MQRADSGLQLSTKHTRKRQFLDELQRVVPWADLVALNAGYAPEVDCEGPPFALHTMLRIHFLQQWIGFSDPATSEALHDTAEYRYLAQLDWTQRLPDETAILRFRRLLQAHRLSDQMPGVVNGMLGSKALMHRTGTVVDATLIAAPSATQNAGGERGPDMDQTKKGNQWSAVPKTLGMKAHIGVDAESGLVHPVKGTPANANNVIEANALLHGDETDAFT